MVIWHRKQGENDTMGVAVVMEPSTINRQLQPPDFFIVTAITGKIVTFETIEFTPATFYVFK